MNVTGKRNWEHKEENRPIDRMKQIGGRYWILHACHFCQVEFSQPAISSKCISQQQIAQTAIRSIARTAQLK